MLLLLQSLINDVMACDRVGNTTGAWSSLDQARKPKVVEAKAVRLAVLIAKQEDYKQAIFLRISEILHGCLRQNQTMNLDGKLQLLWRILKC